MMEFTEDYLTGIPEIDKEHKQLFAMLDQTNKEVLSGADIRTTGMGLLNDLKDYAATHFAHEEAYMESIDDPELPRQRKAHRAFIDRMNNTNFIGMPDDTMRQAVVDLLD